MLYLLLGNDYYKCDQFVTKQKDALDASWSAFNFHRYQTDELELAVTESATMPFGDRGKVLVIEGDIKAEHEPRVSQLLSAPDFSTIIFRVSIDARTKVGKLIKSKAKIVEYSLPSVWKQEELARYIQREAHEKGFSLSSPVAAYLADAIGEDSYRIHNELEKIYLHGKDGKITVSDVQSLVPNLTQNVLKLAEDIRLGNKAEVLVLVNELLSRGEHPLKITAALLTIFRRWLIVKAVKNMPDEDLAKRCNLTNPKRLYYLRNQASVMSVEYLKAVVVMLFEVECGLKSGLDEAEFVLRILSL